MASAIFAPITDVVYVGDLAEGAPDTDVLALAASEQRILVTEDFDFGRLIFKDGAGPPPGLIHLTLAGMTKVERYAKLTAEAEALIAAAPGRFVVFSKGAMRARALPKGA